MQTCNDDRRVVECQSFVRNSCNSGLKQQSQFLNMSSCFYVGGSPLQDTMQRNSNFDPSEDV